MKYENTMHVPKFIHLNVHSDYSIIDGLSKPEDLVKKAAYLGMPALAITDINNLYGIVKFYNIAHRLGVKPIIGVTSNLVSEFLQNELTTITILASSQEGYKNLILLISKVYQKGSINNHYLAMKKKWLLKHNKGLILLSGGVHGEIGKILINKEVSLISPCINFYQKYFPDAYYLELSRTNRENEEEYLNLAVDVSLSYNIPVVATNHVCFLDQEDFYAHKIRIAINEGQVLQNSKIQDNYSHYQFLKNEQEMCSLFLDLPEALQNSVEISKRCNVYINSGKYFLPNFSTGTISVEKYLVQKSYQGLKKRLNIDDYSIKRNINIYTMYKNRLKKELNIINKMGFPGYFLIVMEFIEWAKKNNIPVGPGRGSGSGSLVAYALKITEIDPLCFNLIFERFLNPERVSLPDFDIDFCMDTRDQVIDHVIQKYGRNAVSQIITFGTMTAKAVIRDVGRVLGYPYGFLNKLSKLVPSDPGITLKEAFLKNSELSDFYQNNDDVKRLINMAKKLEGTIRNIGKHAGGLVISPTKITDFCPLYCDASGNNLVTQFDKNDVEFVGLVKFDFLGLRTLTTIHYAVKMINQSLQLHNKKTLNMHCIPLNDKKCFNFLKTSETIGVFQLESYGMKDLIKRLKPDCFEDIVALLALFRPGPLQSGMVDNFINRKHKREKVSYPDVKWQHILLKPILKSTYGVILYQEQVMQIAQVLSGYTLGKADLLRRAISKKNFKDMENQRLMFESGAKKNGIDAILAEKIFNLLEKFAGYGFNKSHSVAYALISYQTLWLKFYYPAEFIAAAMTADMYNTEKIIILVNESVRLKVKILPPDINISKYKFYVNHYKQIVYSLGAIKGVGEASVRNIMEERKKNGFFTSLFDFCTRTDSNKITRRVLEKLIMSGSCDCLHRNRNYLLQSIDNTIQASKEFLRTKNAQQQNLFGSLKHEFNQVKEKIFNISYSKKNKLSFEYQSLGFYLTGHPIDEFSKELKYYLKNTTLSQLGGVKKRQKFLIAGIIVSIKIKKTKNNHRIGIITLDDNTARLEVVIFTELLNTSEYLLKLNKILVVEGILDIDLIHKNIRMTAYSLMNLNMLRIRCIKKLHILLPLSNKDCDFLKEMCSLISSQCLGSVPVSIFCTKANNCLNQDIYKTWLIMITEDFLKKLQFLVYYQKIQIKFDF